jgi:hypothetical protein
MQACSSLPLIILIIALFSPRLQAEVKIVDQSQILDSLFVKSKTPFEQAFHCSQPKNFFIQVGKCKISCSDDICKETCASNNTAEAVAQAEDCTDDSVQIYTSMGHVIPVLKSDYEQSGHTILLSVLKQMENFYEPIDHINITRVWSLYGGKLIEGGKLVSVPTVKVSFELYPEETIPANFPTNYSHPAVLMELELDLNRSGLDQLMYLYPSTSELSKTDFVFKRKGFIHALF